MATTATVASGASAVGGATGWTILLNMWMKRHGYEALQPEDAMAIVTVISPIFHTLIIVMCALIKALLKKLGVTVLDDVPAPVQ